jgi:DNA-directed RNA polymerase subunit RPC12/RpoP
MAIEYEMPLGMLIRKMYCAGCGTRLVRKKVRKTYRRGEEGFRNTLSNRSTINVQSYTAVTYVYRCPNCNKEISYDDQVKVAKKQAQAGRKILLEKE